MLKEYEPPNLSCLIKDLFSKKNRVLLAGIAAFLGTTIFSDDQARNQAYLTQTLQPQSILLATETDVAAIYKTLQRADESEQNKPKTCIETGFTPDTVLADGKDKTVLEVEVKEDCRIGLRKVDAILASHFYSSDGPGPVPIELNDEGRGKDRQANDFTFTSVELFPDPHLFTQTPAAENLYEGIKSLYQGYPISFIRLTYADGIEKQLGSQPLLIMDKSTPLVDTKDPKENFRVSKNIINIKDDKGIATKAVKNIDQAGEVQQLTNEFYKLVENDNYHFLSITTNRKIVSDPPLNLLTNHFNSIVGNARRIRTDFQGTGVTPYYDIDKAKAYGSKGELRLITIMQEPLSSWLAFHEFTHLAGASMDALELSSKDHWNDNTSVGGILYGTVWVDNKDGTYTTQGRSFNKLSTGKLSTPKLSSLEQYLLGLGPAEKVKPIIIALNREQNFMYPGSRIEGPFKKVAIKDIIKAYGTRTPGPDQALKDFQIGYLYATPRRLATAAEMTARELIAERLRLSWVEATDNNSTIKFVTPLS